MDDTTGSYFTNRGLLLATFRKKRGVSAIVKLTATVVAAMTLSACGGGNALTAPGSGADRVAGGSGKTSYAVTASAGVDGTISPAGAATVNAEATPAFTVTANAGYSLSSVGGTCGGALSGDTYTTDPITADCTVVSTFSRATPNGAIAACFTVSKEVTFGLTGYSTATNVPALPVPAQRSVGPASFNGQAATRATTTATPIGAGTSFSESEYWAMTSDGVLMLGHGYSDGTNHMTNPSATIPLNMQPGEFVDLTSAAVIAPAFDKPARYTFIGLETISLAGKTFFDVCHFQLQGIPTETPHSEDHWYAPGYGEIQSAFPSYRAGAVSGYRYSGDL